MGGYAAKLKELLRTNHCRFERHGKAAFASDAQRVEFLFERYQQLTSLLPTEKTVKARKKKAHAC